MSTTKIDGRISVVSHRLDSSLRFVLLVPDQQLSTAYARSVLPGMIPHGEAAFNIGRVILLLKGLADAGSLVPAAGDDMLHQQYRERLFPQSKDLINAMLRAGARMASWSGAGSTMLGVCRGLDEARRVRDAGREAMEALEVPGRSVVLTPDFTGLLVESPASLNPFEHPDVGYEPLLDEPRQLDPFILNEYSEN